MNEQIEDERGHMLKTDFKRMLFTAFKGIDDDRKKLLFDMLCPLISAESEECVLQGDRDEMMSDACSEYVSIGKLSSFIDFYNYVPMMYSSIKHKNESSTDLYLYMGKPAKDADSSKWSLNEQDLVRIEQERAQFKRIMSLITVKIHERFKNLLAAFRYFDSDHQLSLTLNEFAQGIEHLRIKISFDSVK